MDRNPRTGGVRSTPMVPPRAPVMTVTLNPAIDLHLDVAGNTHAEVLRTRSHRRVAGGKGVNVSGMLAALGVDSVAACLLGGPDADVFLSLLESSPFPVVPVRVQGETRTNVTIRVDGQDSRIKVNQPGPTVRGQAWRAAKIILNELMAHRRWVVLAGSLPSGTRAGAYAELCRAAHRNGARVAVDCERTPLLRAAPAAPDLIHLNRAELAATTGLSCRSRRATLHAATTLLKHRPTTLLISDGGGEALAIRNHQVWVGRPPRVPVKGPMGAGDAMLAGYIAARLEQQDPPRALARALACGAACAALPETRLPHRRDVVRWLSQVSVDRL